MIFLSTRDQRAREKPAHLVITGKKVQSGTLTRSFQYIAKRCFAHSSVILDESFDILIT